MTGKIRQTDTMRFRIAKGVTLLLLVLFLAVWSFMAERTLRGLNGSLDESIEAMIEFSASQLAQNQDSIQKIDEIAERLLTWTPGIEEFYLEIYSLESRQILARSSYLVNNGSLVGTLSFDDLLKYTEEEGWDVFVGDEAIRCFAVKIAWPVESKGKATGKTKEVLFVAGVERIEADRRFHEILERSGIGLGITMLIAVMGVWIIISRATRPLAGLAEDVATITPKDIRGVRVPPDPQLALLANHLNKSLQAVALAMEREKQFSSDVAHELLTPIGGLRTELEVALLKPREAEELQHAIQNSKVMVLEIQALVEDLLDLGRLEFNSLTIEWREINLSEMVNTLWADQESAAQSRGIIFENRMDAGIHVKAGAHLLNMVLKNLLSNVTRYTPYDAKAWAECEETKDSVILRIMNEIVAPPPDLCTHAFDRFWRGDASRTKENAHASNGLGLGLSIARSAARAIGGELEIKIDQGPVVCFLLYLKRVE